MLTPSNIKKAGQSPTRDFSLQPGEAKEEYSPKSKYTVRAERSPDGRQVTIYKKFAATKNFYKNNVITYQSYVTQLSKPMNRGSLVESF
jgi:hypothetical protein